MKISKPSLKKPSSNFLRKLAPYSKKKIIFIAVGLVIIFMAGFGLVNYFGPNKKQEREIAQKLEVLAKEGAMCEKVVQEIGSYTTKNTDNREDQVVLLEKQMLCFANELQFDKALKSAEELKDIYTQNSDTSNIERIARQIEGIKESQSYQNNE